MKPYLSESDLISELVNNKNIDIKTIPSDIFKERAYTTIVNPYKHFICLNYNPTTKDYVYKKDGDFSDYITMAQIDDYISSKFSIYINHFEKRLKNYLADILAQKLKTINIDCNDYNSFAILKSAFPNDNNLSDTSTSPISSCHINIFNLLCIDEIYDKDGITLIAADKNIIRNRKRAIKEILRISDLSKKTNNLLIEHYKNDNGYVPPIWDVIHVLSLGDLYALYNFLNKTDKIAFSNYILEKRTRSEDIASLSSKINTIRKIRNVINHYEPLLPLLIKGDIEQAELFSIINILKNNYLRDNIQNIRISWKKTPVLPASNDYTKKYLTIVERILKSI